MERPGDVPARHGVVLRSDTIANFRPSHGSPVAPPATAPGGYTREGLAAARARGRVGGRPTVATEEVVRAARDLLPDPGRSITSIAKLLGVSPGTLYNHIPDLRELRAGTVPHQLEATQR